MQQKLCQLVLLVLIADFCHGHGSAAATQFHVSVDGKDSWSGQLARPNAARTDGPFATLRRARDAVRAVHRPGTPPNEGVEVLVHPGIYALQAPLELTAVDSGTPKAPVVYRTAGGKVRLLGGIVVAKWTRVSDPRVLRTLDPLARDHVMQADLKALGIAEYGSPGGGGLELFCDDKPMTLARWPNTGFAKIVGVLGKTERNVRGTKGCVEGIFQYEGERPKRWQTEKDAWVHGYWFWDWSEQRHQIKSIDPGRHAIEVKPPYHNYGYRKGQWFYAFNCLSEIDRPGEWYLDRDTGVIYFWPPGDVTRSEAIVTVQPTLLTMKDVSNVTWQGFIMEGARGTAIEMSGGTRNTIADCTIRNVGQWAVHVSGGTWHRVTGCTLYQMGGGGISMAGGDRTTLTPAHHLADNNHIHHFARVKRVYQPGITLSGVGNRAAHNLIHDAPHMAIGFSGNDHMIELNELYNVCYESNDAGAIYTGRNWTMRGTVIRHNYLHDISGFQGRGCVGVYLDDMFCGTEIVGNVFYRVTRAAFIGGGRDCAISNNLFVDCKPAVHIDARALGWAHAHADGWIEEAKKKSTLSGIHYSKPPYSTRYPRLVTILDDQPKAPMGNVVTHNVSFGGKWDEMYNAAKKFLTVRDNLVDVDPRFVHPDRIGAGKHPRAVDFRLRQDSPAWKVGFQPIPVDQIGLQDKK